MARNKRLIKSKNNSSSGVNSIKGGRVEKKPVQSIVKKKSNKTSVKLVSAKDSLKTNTRQNPIPQSNKKKAVVKRVSKKEITNTGDSDSNVAKNPNKIGTRGKKRSYAELAKGLSSKEENIQVKKQKVSKANQETVTLRVNRSKKPTAKASEFLGSLKSKKQENAKKKEIKAPSKRITLKTKSETQSSSKKSISSKPTSKISNKKNTLKKDTKKVLNKKLSSNVNKLTKNKPSKTTPAKSPKNKKSSKPSTVQKPKAKKEATPRKNVSSTKQDVTPNKKTPARNSKKVSMSHLRNDGPSGENVLVAEEILENIIVSVVKPEDPIPLENVVSKNASYNVNSNNCSSTKQNLSSDDVETKDDPDLSKVDSKKDKVQDKEKTEVCDINKDLSEPVKINTIVMEKESTGLHIIDFVNSPQKMQEEDLLNNKQSFNNKDNESKSENFLKGQVEEQTENKKPSSESEIKRTHLKNYASPIEKLECRPESPQNMAKCINETSEEKKETCLLTEEISTLTKKPADSKNYSAIVDINNKDSDKQSDEGTVTPFTKPVKCSKINEVKQNNKIENNSLPSEKNDPVSIKENSSDQNGFELSTVLKKQPIIKEDIPSCQLDSTINHNVTKKDKLEIDANEKSINDVEEVHKPSQSNLEDEIAKEDAEGTKEESFTLQLDFSNGEDYEVNESIQATKEEERVNKNNSPSPSLVCTTKDEETGSVVSVGKQKLDAQLVKNDPCKENDTEKEVTKCKLQGRLPVDIVGAPVIEKPTSIESNEDLNSEEIVNKVNLSEDYQTSSEMSRQESKITKEHEKSEKTDLFALTSEEIPVNDNLHDRNTANPISSEFSILNDKACEQTNQKMDTTENSPLVDVADCESMICNSETRSSNRMSVDEDNTPMDLDTEDVANNTNLGPNFKGKTDTEVMEVS